MRNYTVEFPSGLYKVKSVVKEVIGFLEHNFPYASERDLCDLRLVYCELLYNAVIHGNKNDSGKYVRLYVEIIENTVYSRVSDEGTGFDHINLLKEAKHEKNLLRDHGRGILLVYSLMDSVSFNNEGNEIKFYKQMRTSKY